MPTSATTSRSVNSASNRVSAPGPTITVISFRSSNNAPLRDHYFPERLPAVSGAASHCQDHSALVRRFGRRLERRDAVFPTGPAGRIRLCALLHSISESEAADDGPRHAAAGQLRAAPHPAL